LLQPQNRLPVTGLPTVSVVIPTYNRASCLGRALQSALRQSLKNLELIVVDDGSTDNSESIVRSFNDPRVRYVQQARNAGAAAARNTGVAQARGEFIAFLDSDDEWLLSKLEKQVSALRTADACTGLALCGLLRWDTLQVFYMPAQDRHGARQPDIREEILRQNYALTSAWCVRRQHFLNIGPFDETLPPLEDWEWLIRYTARYRSVLVDEPLCVVYESPDSISSNQGKYIQALARIVVKHEGELGSMPRAYANLHYVLGKKHCLHHDIAEGRRCYVRAIAKYPCDWRAWIAFALSLFGQSAFRAVWRNVRQAKGVRVGPA
jgi:glycosyltransferase involved in cell wall biosynthesis